MSTVLQALPNLQAQSPRLERWHFEQPLSGKSGIVTGASSGIGRAIAIELGGAGAYVYVGYRQHQMEAMDTVDEITGHGGEACAFQVDVGVVPNAVMQDAVLSIAADAKLAFLVNCAGITAGRSVVRTIPREWRDCLEVNLTGTFLMTQAVLPGMIERKYGRIVNLTSVVGLSGRLGPASYAASKAGVVGFTKASARELASKGITVNAIAPGFIADTGLWPAQVDPELQRKVLSEIPMGRWGRPHEVAHAALYLIAYGDYVTGTVLNVSGGWHT